MSLLVGIVGKPNVGKSTFFKALTMIPVEIANYPFTTIEPNEGVAYVKIECVENYFNVKCNPRTGFCKRGYRFVPVKIMDVAGLVPGAHEGRGLGNQFLDNLRQADVLIHVIDISGSTDSEGKPVEPGSYDPSQDIIWLEDEIDYWFYNILKKNLKKIERKIEIEKDKAIDLIHQSVSGLKIKREHVIYALRKANLSPEDLKNEENLLRFAKELRKVSKPIIIAANKIDVETSEKFLKKLQKEFPDKITIPTSAFAEVILKELDKQGYIEYIPGEKDFEIKRAPPEKYRQALEFIKEKILEKYGSTGVQDALNVAVLNVANYIPVWPVANEKLTDKEGRVLPDVYLVLKGTKVIELAEMIHSDLAKGFIKAKELRTGKIVGKDYELQFNDVIMIIAK